MTEEELVPKLEQRAKDLSLALDNPETLAAKLREELVALAGPDVAASYHIGATFDGRAIRFRIARLGPRLLISATGAPDGSAELRTSFQTTTSGGWRLAIGATATGSFRRPRASDLQAAFSVVVSR